MKQCKKCGGSYPDVFFRDVGNHRKTKEKRPICIGCELTSRTDTKSDNRALAKAKKAIYHHSIKYKMSAREFREKFGWRERQLAHDIEHAFLNGCPYCFRSFSEMPHGMADLSIDIIDRNKPPYYSTNTKWVCITCNTEKQHTPPELWEEKKRSWLEWERNQEIIKNNPLYGLPLFELSYDFNGQYLFKI